MHNRITEHKCCAYRRRYRRGIKVVLGRGGGSRRRYNTSWSEERACLGGRLFQHQQRTVPQVVWLANILDDARLERNRRRAALEDGIDERAQCARVTVLLNDVTAAADERTDYARQRLQPRHATHVITRCGSQWIQTTYIISLQIQLLSYSLI